MSRAFGREFFNLPALLAVVLFALNNSALKSAFPGWITGKLSDITACFFLPLFLSTLLELACGRRASFALRLGVGAILTVVVFTAVKVDHDASDALNWLTRVGNHALGLRPSVNFVDPTDLLALPFVALGYWQGWRSVSSSPAPYSGQPVLREQR